MDEAVGRSVTDVVGLSPDRGAAKVESFALALRHMHTAHVLAVEGAEAAALDVELTGPESLLDSALLVALDSTPSSDTALSDVAMHMRIRSSRDQLRELRERVDALLTKLTSRPA